MVQVVKRKKNSTDAFEEEKQLATQKTLQKMQRASEEEQASALGRDAGLPYLDLNLFPISEDDAKLIPEKDSVRLNLGIFQKSGREIKAAVIAPGNTEAEKYLADLAAENNWKISLFIISKSSLQKIQRNYAGKKIIENLDVMRLALSGKDLDEFDKNFGELLNLKNKIREIPTTQILGIIMSGAVKMKGSDIHFEPQEQETRIRYRIDGVLHEIGALPNDTYKSILSRVKMMSKMKINIRDNAQDGKFSIVIDAARVDVRVNVIPGSLGESIVMRLLDQAAIMLSVEDLGLRGLAYEQIKKQLEKPTGMILTTGPTGSGKTTTLYAFINKLNTPGTKIITIEDPVEYQVKGVSQTQINKSAGYTFGSGLRAIVRQDPDIVLVGEIRDEETAEISVNAALTGHMVLSTIHTNNAAATVPRLLELGVKPSLIPPSVNAFIAQRLVRKLCEHCKEKYQPAKETVESIKKILAIISPKANVPIPKDIEFLYKPKGCPKCHNIGYKGRMGIFEVLTISQNIEKLVLNMAGETEITKAALEEGMITMMQDGILKALEGITSMEEVSEITGQGQFLEEIYEQLMSQSLSRGILISSANLDETAKNISTLKQFNEFVNKSGQDNAFELVLAGAIMLKTGDIHIEPEEDGVKTRFRIDGILQEACTLPLNEYPSFLGRIKILSGLKTGTRAGVQDSRFGINLEKAVDTIKDTHLDVRVSIISGGFGETVVMRLLTKSSIDVDIEKSGIRPETLARIMQEVQKPNGVFLNTGPTGSGKTTTLYSLLNKLISPEIKIITVEDPIEYQVRGVLQTQINKEEGYTFAAALRALMRQNPDIIMVGEIRDEETAVTAMQAALTGHLVLSTLHTNDAAGSVQRLLNMGVRPDDLATASNAFMAQRLVRKLCDCKEAKEISATEKETIEDAIKSLSPKAGVAVPEIKNIFHPKGCEKCNGLGYKGRSVICEVLIIDRDIEQLVSRGALASEIKDKAIENGMITMIQDGVLKVLEGITTLEEVERVAGK